MTDGPAPRVRLAQRLRPSRVFAALRERPRFLWPSLLLVACVLTYVEVAVGKAMPRLVPLLLERALVPESRLVATLRGAFRGIAIVVPVLGLPASALVTWGLLRPFAGRQPYLRVIALVAHASVWISLGLLAKTTLAVATGDPDPPVSLAAFLPADAPAVRVMLALTNPFGLLATATSIAGLRAFGVPTPLAALAGATPWVAWLAGFALLTGEPARLAPPPEPVPTADWPTLTEGPLALRYPPPLERDARALAGFLAPFLRTLGERLGFEPVPIRIHLYPDHATLERASGETLHVLVTGSIRGKDLLYLESPGGSAAVTRERGIREALRYAGILELAPATGDAPRWWVEGFLHAAVHPGTPELEREFRAVLRRRGVPAYGDLLRPAFFLLPEGPLVARSLVDHVAFLHGRAAPERIMRDLLSGTSFRDALFAHTRLTASALEAGWRETLLSVATDSSATRTPAPADSTRPDETVPFVGGR